MSASYRMSCNACLGNNFVFTPSKGFGYCFNCGHYTNEKNTQYIKTTSKYIHEIRGLYTQAAEYYHSSLTSEAYTYLIQRGFNDSTIATLKIGYCPPGMSPLYKGKIAKEAGLVHYDSTGFLADRITFPYFDETGTLVTDIRGRSLDPYDEAKYKSLLGTSYYRGAIFPYNYQLHKQSNQIVITEGEIKADIAVQAGITTLALPGMGSWREGFKENTDKDYVLLFDNQKNHYKELYNAIVKIAKKFTTIRIATLPLLGQTKQDIDSFILRYGIVFFRTIIDTALPFNRWLELQRV